MPEWIAEYVASIRSENPSHPAKRALLLVADDRERLIAALDRAQRERDEARAKLDIRRMAMDEPTKVLRFANPFAFCPQCGGAMRWTAETILRCERDITHIALVAGPYSRDEQIVQNPPPIRHPEVATPEMFAKLAASHPTPESKPAIPPTIQGETHG